MNFVETLLKEQEQLLTDELRFAEDEEYIETGNRLTDVKNALIKLGLCDVGSSLIDKEFIKLVETRLDDYEIANDHKLQKKTSVDIFKGAVKWHYKIDE